MPGAEKTDRSFSSKQEHVFCGLKILCLEWNQLILLRVFPHLAKSSQQEHIVQGKRAPKGSSKSRNRNPPQIAAPPITTNGNHL